MKVLGFGLVVLGVFVLMLGIRFGRPRTVLDRETMQATATELHNVPFSPILGGTAILGGLVLLIMRRRTI